MSGRFKTELGKSLAAIANNLRVLGNFAVADPLVSSNRKFASFAETGIRRTEALANNSVSVAFERPMDIGTAQVGRYNPYGSVFYSTLNDNKAGRLYEYRLMAAYPDVLNALDFICNEFITIDDKGRAATLRYTKPNADALEETTLIEEFEYFERLFNFNDKGPRYCRRFLTEGEIFEELIVNNDTPENLQHGILGVVDIPAELVDTIWKSKTAQIVDSFIGRKPVYDPSDPNRLEKIELVPYQANQLFYVHSGQWDSNGEFMVPFIERARRRYIQLSYIEDAIVIYRLVRAPERLIFTVPTGNMTPYDAERYMRDMMDGYWKQKVMDVNTGDIMQKYNPQSMTDAYYFSKPANGEAISVTQLKGGDNLGELQDLDFFLRALYRDLKVPASFLKEDKAANTDASSILQEELRFADFITSVQKAFAIGLKQAFITHLKFKGLWKKYNLHENHIEITFNQPGTYHLMRQQQIESMRYELYSNVSNNEMISNIYALKKYMGWTDKEILANIEFLKVESGLKWEISQRTEFGPSWKSQLLNQQQASLEQAGGMGDLAGDLGGEVGGDLSMGEPGAGDMSGFADEMGDEEVGGGLEEPESTTGEENI